MKRHLPTRRQVLAAVLCGLAAGIPVLLFLK